MNFIGNLRGQNSKFISLSLSRNIAWFAKLPLFPPDKVFGVNDEFLKDTAKQKVNLSVGAFRDDNGKPYVLQSVRKAEYKITCKELNKEYAGILGNAKFCQLAFDFAMGDDNEISKNGTVSRCQTLSGSGALALAAMFLKKCYPGLKLIYLSKPTWDNHFNIFQHHGICTKTYRYYDSEKLDLDYEGMKDDLCKMHEKSIVLFHVCAHNPTGFDPSPEQWDELAEVCKEKSCFVVFDSAYQGFASGDPNQDAYAIRTFAKAKVNMAICQSFSKNMGLYGERIGCLSITTDTPEEVPLVASHLKQLVRAMYSNPPINGARIVEEIFSDPILKDFWLEEVRYMSNRIKLARKELKEGIVKSGSKLNWDHITKQIGMFSFTGLSKKAVERLAKEFHIYFVTSGRISVAGINSRNIDYVSNAFHQVTSS